MKNKIFKICMVTVVAVGALIVSFLLGRNSVEVLNEEAIEKVAEAKTNDVCQSIMHILNDEDSLKLVTNLDPNEWKTKITVFGPAEDIYYTNYGGRIKVATKKPAFEE